MRGEFVFYTRCDNTWGWRVSDKSSDEPFTKAFKTLRKKAGVVAEKGTGFYTLRRTAATIAARTGDVNALAVELQAIRLDLCAGDLADDPEQCLIRGITDSKQVEIASGSM